MLYQTNKRNLRQPKHSLAKLALLLSLSGILPAAYAIVPSHLPKHQNVPGGVVIIPLQIESDEPPAVFYNKMRALVTTDPANPNHWVAVVGIPIDAKVGIHQLDVTTYNGAEPQQFTIVNKDYPQEHLTIVNKRKVTPHATDLPIITVQYKEIIQTYAQWQPKTIDSLTLRLPAIGRKSSPFGLQRVMNKIPQKPHSGLDIAAPKGTPVVAPKSGLVSNIGNYFYSGNMVFIDHGQGFITSYCHLDTITVRKGQMIKEGEVLGTIGKTGRVTGPHLHWSVSLNGVRVDPQLFINE